MTAFLVATLGGISAVIGYVISPEIRGWDRISIVIAFFALCVVGLGIDVLRKRIGERRRLVWLAAVGVLGLVGIYDQSSREVVPPYRTIASSYGADAAFVQQIQTQVPHDAMIYQLPYIAYPENGPTVNMLDYDQMRGDVHTTTGLRWSYGAIKGSSSGLGCVKRRAACAHPCGRTRSRGIQWHLDRSLRICRPRSRGEKRHSTGSRCTANR